MKSKTRKKPNAGKLIAFRATAQVLKEVEELKKTLGENSTQVLRRAIADAHARYVSGLKFQELSGKLSRDLVE